MAVTCVGGVPGSVIGDARVGGYKAGLDGNISLDFLQVLVAGAAMENVRNICQHFSLIETVWLR